MWKDCFQDKDRTNLGMLGAKKPYRAQEAPSHPGDITDLNLILSLLISSWLHKTQNPYSILLKYGLLNTLIDVINNLYNKCSIQLNLGVELESVPYETGVQQGVNMALILFLFIMQAIMQFSNLHS